MAGYTRQSSYTDGDIIQAADSNDEFDQLLAAFHNSTGHAHDGTAAEGPVIGLIGDPGVTTPLNKVVVDDINNQVEFNIDVSGVSTEQFVVKDGVIEPTTDNDIDLGSSGKEFKNLYIDGTANIDSLVADTADINGGTIDSAVIGGTTAAAITGTTITANTSLALASGATVTAILDEDTMTSDSATALATQQSIKAYVDSQVTAQDLDFQADTGGALSIDLDSETMTFTGGTGIDTSGSLNTVTFAIDSTVATLTGSQTLTNKTLTAPIISTISNTGTLTLPTSTDTLVGRATTDTLTNKTLTSAVLNSTISGTSIKDEDDMVSNSASHLATQQSIKAYVDAQVGANNELSEVLANGNTTGANNIIVTAGQSITVDTISETTAANGVVIDGVTLKDGGATVTADVSFGDNDKAIFGAGSDLQIYHDGSHSYIKDAGTGNLLIQGANIRLESDTGENFLAAFPNAEVRLYYDSVEKLSTTSTGIDVTGTVTADGLTVDGDAAIQNTADGFRTLSLSGNRSASGVTTARLSMQWDGNEIARIQSHGGADTTNKDEGDLLFYTADAGSLKIRQLIDQNGDISFYEDTGTTAKLVWKAADERLGIGTDSPSEPLHVAAASPAIILEDTSNAGKARIDGDDGSLILNADIANAIGSSRIGFQVDGAERMRIDSSGNVGIGTTSPTGKLDIDIATDARGYFSSNIGEVGSGNFALQVVNSAGSALKPFGIRAEDIRFATGSSERMRIDSSGNVGINSTAPTTLGGGAKLTVNQAADGNIVFARGGSTRQIQLGTTSTTAYINEDNASGGLAFHINGSEKARLDNSGNLLVGKTSASFATDGFEARASGQVYITDTTATPLIVRRNSTDGVMVDLYRDGAPVGSIGVSSFDLTIGNDDVGFKFHNASNMIIPWNMTTNGGADNTTNLGDGSNRFKDLHLSNAVVQSGVKATTTATTQVTLETFAHASHDGAKVIITAATSADTYVTELLIATNGTTAVATEYGQIGTGSALATYDVDISGADVRILATPASTTSTTFRVAMTLT